MSMITKIDFDQDKAIEMAESGMDYETIAEYFDMSFSTFTCTMGALGYHRNSRTAKRQKMVKLFRDGKSAKQIAREVGMSVQYVRQELHKMGVRNRHA